MKAHMSDKLKQILADPIQGKQLQAALVHTEDKGYNTLEKLRTLRTYLKDTIENETRILMGTDSEYKATRSASFDSGMIEGLSHAWIRLDAVLEALEIKQNDKS